VRAAGFFPADAPGTKLCAESLARFKFCLVGKFRIGIAGYFGFLERKIFFIRLLCYPLVYKKNESAVSRPRGFEISACSKKGPVPRHLRSVAPNVITPPKGWDHNASLKAQERQRSFWLSS
jgi:hypothetical protein